MQKVVVPYVHESSDLTQIWIAYAFGEPAEGDWKPVFRDTIDGQPVIWAKFDVVPQGNLWIRDRSGVRLIGQ